MRFIIWFIAAISLGVWSAFAWAGRAVVGWAFNALAINADRLAPQEFVSQLYWAATWLGEAGTGIVTAIWIVGAILIFGAASLLVRVVAGRPADAQGAH
jgi:hypothetical protein